MEKATPSSHEPILGSIEWWDDYFALGGRWETNGGRQQTRIFAETFCKNVKLEALAKFRLVDVGCGLGEAICVFRQHYPKAVLTGMDISRVAIQRCEIGLRS